MVEVFRQTIILVGLTALFLSSSGAAGVFHHLVEHAADDRAVECGSCEHSSPDAPKPDRESDPERDCDLCATLAIVRHFIIDDAPSATVSEHGWFFIDRPAETSWSPSVSLTTGPPRGPPFRD
jgi:hypothetical protein